MARSSEEWIAQCAENHPHPINRALNARGIPMIALALLLFFTAFFVQGFWPILTALFVIGWIFQFATTLNAKYCVGLLIALHVSLGEAAAQPRKIVIDCDPGIDDAMAIVLAMQHSGFEIVGISTMFGNAYVDQATRNALTVVELSGRTIPVYQGAAKPRRIAIEPPPDFVHGKEGLGNTNHPPPKSSPQSKSAAQFLVDTARSFPGQITLVAVGRLTNLADAIRLDSSFTSNIREVVLMGGAFHVPGNVSPVAEANISGDPDAADIVLTAPWKVTMLALNTITKVKLSDEILLRIRDQNDRYGRFIWSITRFYMDFHKNVNHVEGGFYVHDPSGDHVLDRSGPLHDQERPSESGLKEHAWKAKRASHTAQHRKTSSRNDFSDLRPRDAP